jgi:hypothetical protein
MGGDLLVCVEEISRRLHSVVCARPRERQERGAIERGKGQFRERIGKKRERLTRRECFHRKTFHLDQATRDLDREEGPVAHASEGDCKGQGRERGNLGSKLRAGWIIPSERHLKRSGVALLSSGSSRGRGSGRRRDDDCVEKLCCLRSLSLINEEKERVIGRGGEKLS